MDVTRTIKKVFLMVEGWFLNIISKQWALD